MSGWMIWLAGILSGIAGAMGLGGGGVLILYLVLIAGVEQVKAQGINLLFFLPCGLVAILLHAFHKRIRWKTVLPCVAGGIGGVLLGTWLLSGLNSAWLSKGFALGLIALGLKELFSKAKKED